MAGKQNKLAPKSFGDMYKETAASMKPEFTKPKTAVSPSTKTSGTYTNGSGARETAKTKDKVNPISPMAKGTVSNKKMTAAQVEKKRAKQAAYAEKQAAKKAKQRQKVNDYQAKKKKR